MDREDIQGIVLHGYRSLPFASYHLLGFDAGAPRPVLARLVNDASSAAEPRATWRLQFALTASGLGALGLSAPVLAQFPREFRQGMAHPERSAALGDSGDEAPEAWEFGGPTSAPLGALCMTYAATREQLAERCEAHERLFERFGMAARRYDAEALPVASAVPAARVPRRQRVPLGEYVLGERDVVGERQRGPFVPVKYGSRPMPEWSRRERAFDFGISGSYLVVRKLARVVPIEPAEHARLALDHARRALGDEGSRAHRLVRRSRRLSDGLWFMALNTNIRRQFEFVQQSQCNEAGPDGARDPFIGRAPGQSADGTRLFRVRGGAYFFLPGIRALNYLVEAGG